MQFDDKTQKERLEEFRAREAEDLAQFRSQQYGLSYINLTGQPISTEALALIPETTAREAHIAAFDLAGKQLKVAVFNLESETVKNVISELSKKYTVTIFIATKASLLRAWERYGDITATTKEEAGTLTISRETIEKTLSVVSKFNDLEREVHELLQSGDINRISRLVEILLAGAIALHASDLHIEPEQDSIRIRIRIDGVLYDIIHIDQDLHHRILSRIKLLSGMKLNITSDAQDGRFSIRVQNKEIEVRAAVIPGSYGESTVLRVLDPDMIMVTLEKLGMLPNLLTTMQAELEHANGMILTTGPTGSGKTTTLYAFLQKVYKPGIKILTIEEPIEYRLEGIVQTQVEKEQGYTFQSGLRSLLRQDPDVLMVGEIRDYDTAETAMHASLTGHLVFSTLHTNSAAATFPRLADLGVNPSITGDSINVAIAQRLVRVLRPEMSKEVPIPDEYKDLVVETVSSLPDEIIETHRDILERGTVRVPITKEGEIPYKGRIGLFEAIQVTEDVENLVREQASTTEIERAARNSGFMSLKQDGVLKMLMGLTDLSELKRVLDF